MPMPMPMPYYGYPMMQTVPAAQAINTSASANASAIGGNGKTPANVPAPSVNTAPWHKPSSNKASLNAAMRPSSTASTTSTAANVNIKVKPTPTTTAELAANNAAKPIAAVSSPAKSKWSAGMKAYVERCFASCKTAQEKDVMEEVLRGKIKAVLAQDKMNAIEWEKEPIPRLGVIGDSSRNANGSGNGIVIASANGKSTAAATKMQAKAAANKQEPTKPSKAASEEDRKRLERQKRFAADEREFRLQQERNRLALQNVSIADNLADVPDWDEETIVGTCQRLEKPYLRLTSAPDPATVRPLPVLKRALEWLKEKWRSGGGSATEYGFICDQFKSLRQDMTVQRIKSDFTVSVYEIHARIAIEQGDWGEYNQCQTQLKQLYSAGLKGHEQEFLAYRLLYLLQCGDKLGVLEFLESQSQSQSNKSNDDSSSSPLLHALAVQEALNLGDHARLFELYRTAPNMGGYLMDLLVQRERLEGLKGILRAYRPTVSLGRIATTLGFAGEAEGREWLRQAIGISVPDGVLVLDCKEGLQKLLLLLEQQ